MAPAPRSNLSSNDPSARSVAVRLPADLANAIEAACAEQNITASEFLRGLVSSWFYGVSQLAGPDAGYAQAKSMASQLAHAALRKALAEIPNEHGEAVTMLQGYYGDQAERRKR